jgi:hypothetical protein
MPKLRAGRRISHAEVGKIAPTVAGPQTPSSTQPLNGHPDKTTTACEVMRRVGVP